MQRGPSTSGPGAAQGTSPRVLDLGWGRIETEAGTFRDGKLWPGGGRGWDWRETGTHHDPGVQAADLGEVLDHGPEVVVVGCGQQGRLGVPQEAVDAVRGAGVELEVHRSQEAVRRYNELVDRGRRVGALLHSTC